MQYWVAIVDADQFAAERLYANEALVVRMTGVVPNAGDPVLLVSVGDPALLFGLGRVVAWHPADGLVTIRYTHRLLDDPRPIADPTTLTLAGPPTGPELRALPAERFAALAAQVPAVHRTDADRAEWFVSLALPIEAASPAEAVREFWSYVEKLGPQELATYVWPRDNELAMQSFVLGTPANQDPEEDDD